MQGLPVNCLISSVAGGFEVRPPLGDLGRALFRQALLVLWGHPGVSPLGFRTKCLPSLIQQGNQQKSHQEMQSAKRYALLEVFDLNTLGDGSGNG